MFFVKEKRTFCQALLVMAILAAVMLVSVVKYDASPHIPMLFGTVLASASALASGKKWSEVEKAMIKGIESSLSSLVILLLIGVLMGAWILDGVVPSMVYYGLSLISPKIFLPVAMLLCALLSMLLGSWGTIGTVGLALIGLAQALDFPLALTAGAIVSGSYLGDRISPLSDTANLSSAVTSVEIFENVKQKIYIPITSIFIAGILYFIIGLRYAPSVSMVSRSAVFQAVSQTQLLQETLLENFPIGILYFLPLAALVSLMVLRCPAIPAIVLSILTAVAQSMIFRCTSLGQVLTSCMDGYVVSTGTPIIDKLFTGAGLNSMLYSLSMIMCSMMFGGVMKHTGQMSALISPIMKYVQGTASLIATTIGSCLLVNIFIPEEYLSISITGSLYLSEFDKRGIPRKELAYTIGVGGSATSSLIPWNTCGVFITSVLGVSPVAYATFSFYNILLPVLTIMAAYFSTLKIAPTSDESKAIEAGA